MKRASLQERRGAKSYSGTRNSGSGNGWIRKADVRTDFELIEFKTTTHASYSLKAAELQKLWDQALVDDRLPLFEIEYVDSGVTCVILDKSDYLRMREQCLT